MSLAVIAAMTGARVIGRDNALPWKLGEDLQRFKRLTMGHPIIMGRKTWDSLPRKPLPGRLNLVVSRNAALALPEGAALAGSLEEAEALARRSGSEGGFVIGGAGLFAAALPRAARLHLTLIHHDFPGDVFFPEIDWSLWNVSTRERHAAPEGWDYEFIDAERKQG